MVFDLQVFHIFTGHSASSFLQLLLLPRGNAERVN